MEQNNYDNLKGVGKRIPYKVPDDFFTTLEENVMREVTSGAPAAPGQPERRAIVIMMLKRASIAAAAGIDVKRSVRAAEDVSAVGAPYAAVELVAVEFVAPGLNVFTVVHFADNKFFIGI